MSKYIETNDVLNVIKELCSPESNLSMDLKRGIKKVKKKIEKITRKPITIYTIYVCEKLEPLIYESGKDSGFNDRGSDCVMGFFTEYNDCVRALHTNACDMFETCYNYACVEECIEGIAEPGMTKQWFKYNKEKNGYFEIPTPDRESNVCGRSFS